MHHLFEPLTIKSVTLRNRIGMSPMCMYSSDDGHANDFHYAHMVTRAMGGVGLLIAEATAVLPEGRISPGDAGLWKDSQIAPLKRITDEVKKYGGVPGIQLAHAGRKASAALPSQGGAHLSSDNGGWDIYGPSAIAFGGDLNRAPIEASAEYIASVANAYRDAASRALQAGYEWIEIHAAHGYFLHSFMSPLSNKRTDQYGGSFENRTRALFEVIAAIQTVWPQDKPLTVRISSTDWMGDEGWTLHDSVELAKKLQEVGIDMVDASSGGNVPKAPIPVGAGYQVHLADTIKRDTGMPTSAVGLITDAMQADQIIRSGQADLVLLGRELLRDPYWTVKAAIDLHKKDAFKPVAQYLAAY